MEPRKLERTKEPGIYKRGNLYVVVYRDGFGSNANGGRRDTDGSEEREGEAASRLQDGRDAKRISTKIVAVYATAV